MISIATLNNDSISAQEKSNIQDRFIGFLRRIANDFGPHITLVVHPCRVNEVKLFQLLKLLKKFLF